MSYIIRCTHINNMNQQEKNQLERFLFRFELVLSYRDFRKYQLGFVSSAIFVDSFLVNLMFFVLRPYVLTLPHAVLSS